MARKKTQGRGRPTRYKAEFAEQAYKLCLLGATDADLASFFKVYESTINNWKHWHKDFLESIKNGKEVANANVAASLYHRAIGYSHPEDKIFNDNGKPLIVPTIKHYPPEHIACIYWLNNRDPKRWRNVKAVEVSGPDKGPVDIKGFEVLIVDETQTGDDYSEVIDS